MKAVITEINDTALQPYLNEEITQKEALEKASAPIKKLCLNKLEKEI